MQLQKLRASRAFTLIEVLVVVAIIAILATLVLPVLKGAQSAGKMAREINSAKQIIGAYARYPAEHEGDLLLGYDKNTTSVSLTDGRTVSGEMACRYPWRLAPYLSNQVEDVFLLGDAKRTTAGRDPNSFDYEYRASLNPALGINAYCVGGYDDGSGAGNFSTDVVRRAANAARPANLIVLVSARMKIAGTQDSNVDGNFIVSPPKLFRTRWPNTPYDPASPSSSFGNVSMRWNNQATCAFLDGHVALLAEKELRDMRHWSNTAAENNDPDYTVPR